MGCHIKNYYPTYSNKQTERLLKQSWTADTLKQSSDFATLTNRSASDPSPLGSVRISECTFTKYPSKVLESSNFSMKSHAILLYVFSSFFTFLMEGKSTAEEFQVNILGGDREGRTKFRGEYKIQRYKFEN